MKKLILFLLLTIIALPAAAENDAVTKYSFFNDEFGIRIPDSFTVIHENITAEELAGTGTTPEDAIEFLNSYSMNLYASFDNENKYLAIQVFSDSVSSGTAFEGIEAAEYLSEYWAEQLSAEDYSILFIDPYITEYDCFGKVAFMYEIDDEIVYCIDYITILENDLINLSFSSYNGQFNIEDDHAFNTIASTLFDNVISVSMGV